MENVMNGKGLSKCDTFKPKVDETPVPCKSYHSTDCIYISDMVDFDKLGLFPKSNLSELINTMICRIQDNEKIIDKLNRKLKRLEDGY